MALEHRARPWAQSCIRCARHAVSPLHSRGFALTVSRRDTEASATPSNDALDPFLVETPRQERRLLKRQGLLPIGSRRRRAALRTSDNIPFEQLPYQCFQEARKVLQEDRVEKLKDIRVQRERIARLTDRVVVGKQEEAQKEHRLQSMREHLEELKIQADINDPMVKRRDEDGEGDMDKPIYRYLADRKWREYKRKVLMQRIEQMNVIPDVLPHIDPTVSTTLSFSAIAPDSGRSKYRVVQHGDFVDSRVSEHAPHLNIQPFGKGEKLISIAIVTPDVPNVAKDAFDYRCHFLACNIPISPTNTTVKLDQLSSENQVVLPWLPAYAQKGSPYQRMSVFVFEQPASQKVSAGSAVVPPSKSLDLAAIKADSRYSTRADFILRSFATKFALKPIGVDLFRTKWDEGTAGVMQRAGIVGWDVEFKRKRIEPLPYKRLKEERYR